MYRIYTRKFPPCNYCTAAKQYLDFLKIPYKELDIDLQESKIEFVKNGWKTVPQIIKDDVHIGGYRDLVDHLKGFKNKGEE